jgi:hypothetical protein
MKLLQSCQFHKLAGAPPVVPGRVGEDSLTGHTPYIGAGSDFLTPPPHKRGAP